MCGGQRALACAYYAYCAVHLHSERVRQKSQREKIRERERERERVLLDENCRNVKTIGLSSTTQKVFIFLLALNGPKMN